MELKALIRPEFVENLLSTVGDLLCQRLVEAADDCWGELVERLHTTGPGGFDTPLHRSLGK